VQGESIRRSTAPNQVIAQFFLDCFPTWIKARLDADFRYRNGQPPAGELAAEGMPYSPADEQYGLAVQGAPGYDKRPEVAYVEAAKAAGAVEPVASGAS
jgi:hypothetical protein